MAKVGRHQRRQQIREPSGHAIYGMNALDHGLSHLLVALGDLAHVAAIEVAQLSSEQVGITSGAPLQSLDKPLAQLLVKFRR